MSLDPPITLVGELTLDDVRTGWRLAEASIWTRLFRTTLILVTLGCFYLLWKIGIATSDHDRVSSDRMLAVICVIVPLTVIVWYALRRHHLQRAWERKERIFQKIDTTISAEGISMQQAHMRSEIQWAYFTGFRRSENVIVLYDSMGWVLFGRSRFGSDADWERFVSFVETTIPRRL